MPHGDPTQIANIAYKGFGLFHILDTPEKKALMNANIEKMADLFEALGISQSGAVLVGAASNDASVNQAKTFINHKGELIFQTDKKNTGQVAGNFNGGGTGNKPIALLPGFEGVSMANFPVIGGNVELRTTDDADEKKLGVSYNGIIDLAGDGNGPFVVMVITNTLSAGGGDAPNGESGASASIHDFDINQYSDDGSAPGMKNEFFIVLNLPGTGTGNASPGGNPSWPGNPINLDILLNGGTMPVTGRTFDPAYPNAKLVACNTEDLLADDGGHPAGRLLAGLMAQAGDSANSLRSVTALTQLTLNGISALPT
jgi:hypothetical protein